MAQLVVIVPPNELLAAIDEVPPGTLPEDVFRALKAAGVTHGIDEKAVRAAVRQAQESKLPVRQATVARGKQVVHGTDGEIAPAVADGLPVLPGTVVAYIKAAGEGESGFTVRGRKYPAKPGKAMKFQPGENTTFGHRNEAYVSAIYGVPRVVRGRVVVEPALRFLRDDLAAEMDLYARTADDQPMTLDLARKVLKAAHVVEGVREDRIRDALRQAAETGAPALRVVVAEGVEPVPGSDAQIVAHVMDGDVVVTGTKLVEKKDLVEPGEGKTVTGRRVAPSRPKDARLPRAERVVSVENDRALAAACYGSVRLSEDACAVDPLVTISEDGLRATIEIHASASSGAPVTVDHVVDALRAAGVKSGIDRAKIEGYLGRAALDGTVVPDAEVAFGAAPKDGADGRVELAVGEAPRLARRGDILARVVLAERAKPGSTVTGEVLPAADGKSAAVDPGENVEAVEGGKALRAVIDGYARVEGSAVHVERAVRIADDRMTAWLKPHPCAADAQVILDLLHRSGVKAGIETEAIRGALGARKPLDEIIVARAVPPTPGADGRHDFRVDVGLKPGVTLPDGRLDFRQRDFAHALAAGQVIAERVDPKPGKAGMTVIGEPLAPPPVHESPIVAGENVEETDDRRSLKASKEGLLFVIGNVVCVLDAVEVRGDVNFSSGGNIDVDTSVVVQGSVRSTFRVKSAKHVHVGEAIEDAVIEAAGNVEVAGGVIMGERGWIDSGGVVKCRHAENARIKAKTGVDVAGALVSCRVRSGNWIRVTGGRGAAVGGHLQASQRIEVRQAGSPMEPPTVLEVGRGFERLDAIDARLAELSTRHAKIEAVLGARVSDEFWAGREDTLQQLLDEVDRIKQERAVLEAERALLLKDDEAGAIVVWGTAFPRVKIVVNRRSLELKRGTTRTRFELDPSTGLVVAHPA